MKKYLLAVSMVALIASNQAYAADVVQTYDAPEVAPVAAASSFNWEGFYIGGQIGGAWTQNDASLNYHPAGGSTQRLYGLSLDANGVVGGLYAGYNFALANDVVLGLETDLVLGDVDKQSSYMTDHFDYGSPGGIDIVGRVGVKQKWAGATRIRAGYAMDRFLPYISAGVAYAKAEGRGDGWIEDPATGNVTAELSAKEHKTFTGWTLGVGADYAVTDNVLLRAEYRYSDYGNKTYHVVDMGDGDSLGIKFEHKAHDLRLGVAYKF